MILAYILLLAASALPVCGTPAPCRDASLPVPYVDCSDDVCGVAVDIPFKREVVKTCGAGITTVYGPLYYTCEQGFGIETVSLWYGRQLAPTPSVTRTQFCFYLNGNSDAKISGRLKAAISRACK